MKGSPLTIVVIAAVVIIGGSIVTYLLIENSPQESGFDPKPPEDGRTIKKRVPRPNVYEDTEPLALPPLQLPENETTGAGDTIGGNAPLPQRRLSPPTTPQGSGGEIVKPLPPLILPEP